MKNIHKQSGFSAIELLITLFIAAAFLISGYQLYALVMKDSGDVRFQAKASNVATDYLQSYKSSPSIQKPCATSSTTPLANSNTIPGLSNVTVTVTVSCPYSNTTSVSKLSVTVQYSTPQQSITSSTYVYKP